MGLQAGDEIIEWTSRARQISICPELIIVLLWKDGLHSGWDFQEVGPLRPGSRIPWYSLVHISRATEPPRPRMRVPNCVNHKTAE